MPQAFGEDALGDDGGVQMAHRTSDRAVSAVEVLDAVIELVSPLAVVVIDAFDTATIEARSRVPYSHA